MNRHAACAANAALVLLVCRMSPSYYISPVTVTHPSLECAEDAGQKAVHALDTTSAPHLQQ